MSQVEVRMMKRTGPQGDPDHILVLLSSEVKPQLKAQVEVPLEGSEARLAMAVGVAAGALAEYLDGRYGDRLDPSECHRRAVEAFQELVADYRKLMSEGAPPQATIN